MYSLALLQFSLTTEKFQNSYWIRQSVLERDQTLGCKKDFLKMYILKRSNIFHMTTCQVGGL